MSSVTLVHPAIVVVYSCVVLSNIVLDRGPAVPPQQGKIWGSGPPVRSDAAYRQITLALAYFAFFLCRLFFLSIYR